MCCYELNRAVALIAHLLDLFCFALLLFLLPHLLFVLTDLGSLVDCQSLSLSLSLTPTPASRGRAQRATS